MSEETSKEKIWSHGIVLPMATSVPATSVPGKLGKSRAICWTLHNYNEEHITKLREYASGCSYIIWGYEECPTTGRKHLQGFVCFQNPRSLDKFKESIDKSIHLEKMKGTHQQASDYCKYDDYPTNKVSNKFEEFGELPRQGARTDWSVAVEAIAEHQESIESVILQQPQLLPCIKALERFKVMTLKPKHRDVIVEVLWGESGSGKSRYAWDNYGEDLYSKPRGEWWDGYTGQLTILLDDYYGYLPYCELLRVLDRYPYQVPVKGGFVQAQWTRVIITSNKPPRMWYSSRTEITALKRRINEERFVGTDYDKYMDSIL